MSFKDIVIQTQESVFMMSAFPEVTISEEFRQLMARTFSSNNSTWVFYEHTFTYQTSDRQYALCPNQYLYLATLFRDLAVPLKKALDAFYTFLSQDEEARIALNQFENQRANLLNGEDFKNALSSSDLIKDMLIRDYAGFTTFFNDIGGINTDIICYSLGPIGTTGKYAKNWIGQNMRARGDVFRSYIMKLAPLPDFGSSLSVVVEKLAENSILYDQLCNNALIDNEYNSNDENERLNCGHNILLYGVPGAGKSHIVATEYCAGISENQIQRVVFHPEYSYSDFVGQILPKVTNRNTSGSSDISYEFSAGPFTRIVAEAYQNPSKKYVLVIEELNRGNAPAIFGEMFQLLDRKLYKKDVGDNGLQIGSSEYGVTCAEVAKYVYGDEHHKVYIPSNLEIVSTMNTSDQNVFSLDTAFQRRWEMQQIENTFDIVNDELAKAEIAGTELSWEKFCTAVNEMIINEQSDITSSEDKRLGVYFISKSDLDYAPINQTETEYGINVPLETEYKSLKKKKANNDLGIPDSQRMDKINQCLKINRKFPEKVLKYLWDDVFRYNRDVFFSSDMTSLEKVVKTFLFSPEDKKWSNILSDNALNAFGLNNGLR